MNDELAMQGQKTISLLDVFSNIWAKKLLSALVILVFTAAGFIYGTFFTSPKYVSEAKLVVLEATETGRYSSADLAISTYLVTDYGEMVTDRAVLDQVISELGLNMTYEQLLSHVTIKNPENSRILEVTVSTTDPALSQRIGSKICHVSKAKIASSLGVDKVTIFSDANLPKRNSSVSRNTFMALGFVGGLVILFLIAVVITSLDDKIKGADDVEQFLGLCTLATIPYNSSKSNPKSKNGGKSHKHRQHSVERKAAE